ncbi:MAG: exo-alpha-sialidase, partial [Kiritimatiellae bacterium]|nr:exo-alpha-sialidase [Kiritimatiellia bacterium]
MIPHKIGIFVIAAQAAVCLMAENPNRIKPLADDFVVVCKSPDPQRVYCFTPGICRLPSGRLVATCDLGGPGVKGPRGRIFVSDDHGKTWRKTGEFPLAHARPFLAGGKLYILGHSGDLGVLRSSDDGETWSETEMLTKGEKWHQSACNVWYAKGNVYLVMERRVPSPDGSNFGWGVNRIEPVLMRAKETDDLTKRESWTFAESFCFDSIFGGNPDPELDYVGIPWYTAFTAFCPGVKNPKKSKIPAGMPRSQ